jgi:hypothetical protein
MKNIFNLLMVVVLWWPGIGHSAAQKYMQLETGAGSWEIYSAGVTFSLTQILPDQVKAFYVNRGFTLEQIRDFERSCVYMTVLRNDNAPGTIHFISNDWLVQVNGKRQPLVPVSEWLERFESAGISKAALVAFRWAQFPPEQSYEPGGDWNQGMLSMGLPPGSIFDVTARWDIDGKGFETTLKGIRCDR